MKISIITVCYNNLEGLKTTCNSVLEQMCLDYEFIVIDGASTDGSSNYLEEICPKFEIKGIKCIFISEKDSGIYNAMNKGISFARGEYSIFMNSGDCFYNGDVLTKMVECLNGEDVIYGDTLTVKQDGVIELSLGQPVDIEGQSLGICHQSSFIKTELLKNTPYDEKYKIASDRKFFTIMYQQGKIFKYYPITVAKFLLGGISCDKYHTFKEFIAIRKELGVQNDNFIKRNILLFRLKYSKRIKKLIPRFILKMMNKTK